MSDKIESKEELIKAGVLKGREALEWLDKNGSYVYHGSPQKLHRLEPRQAHQFNPETGVRTPDGKPAVCTAGNYEMAIFKAVLKETGDKDKGDWSSFWVKRDGENKKIFFKATKNMLEITENKKPIGYVHVFNKSEFEQYNSYE